MKIKVEKALDVLKDKENLRKVYDYDLMRLCNAIKDELSERDEQRAVMINRLEDMCKWLAIYGKTVHTFYYSPKSPKELMEADDDEVTDEGFEKIRQQIEDKVILTFEYEENIFRVRSYIDLEQRKGEFKMEAIPVKAEKKL